MNILLYIKYKKNNYSSVKRKESNIKICCKLNKEFGTDGVTLARPQFFDEWYFEN